ncbi:MAG: WecB/TagA/CpsF family glycosyltransferase [Clostridia bacterium]|nr:WecB/TagA/CpsF family glycosyltransferase [Clostridia bacterium]
MAENKNSLINVRGVNFQNTTLDGTVDALLAGVREKRQTALYTPNSEIVQACIEAPELYEVINSAELIIPDGIGVVKAAKILGTPFGAGKIAGCEVGEAFIKRLAETDHTVFLLGGKPGVAEQAAQKLSEKYPGIKFAGTHDGYFKK